MVNVLQDMSLVEGGSNCNFVDRTLTLTASRLGGGSEDGQGQATAGRVPTDGGETISAVTGVIPCGGQWGSREEQLRADVNTVLNGYRGCLRGMEFHKGALALKNCGHLGTSMLTSGPHGASSRPIGKRA